MSVLHAEAGSPALRGAVRAAALARWLEGEAAVALPAAFGWDDLLEWPDWAEPQADGRFGAARLAPRLGALWHAQALRQCIDGRALAAAAAAIGTPALEAVLADATAPAAGAAALPAASEIAATFAACGQALLLCTLQREPLRAAVAAVLPPAAGPAAALPLPTARRWLAQVQEWGA